MSGELGEYLIVFFLSSSPLWLLAFGGLVGFWLYRKGIKNLESREGVSLPVIHNLRDPNLAKPASTSGLITANVVMSPNYFQLTIGGLWSLIGGNIGTYDPVLAWARREALQRLKEVAGQEGWDTVINMRMETTRLAAASSGGKGMSGIEILMYGTGIKYA